LIYGHYDVQPEDPVDAWQSPPFQPTIREGKIYGRGSADNKGQMLAHVLASGALKQTGWPAINVKFLFDGEEESGSPNLPAFLAQHKDLFKADFAYSSDGPKHESGRPVVFFGVRGLLYVELVLRGARHDFHSGNRGGVLPQPAWQLVHLLNQLYDDQGHCQLPGFYDDVVAPSEFEQQLLSTLPFDKDEFLRITGLPCTDLNAASYWRKLMFEPTFNICGLTSGYQGEGSKTIIPARASAKIDMRLVPNQDPEKIMQSLKQFLAKHAPEVELINHGAYLPSRTPIEQPVCQTIIQAVAEAYGQDPVIQPRLGGSAPDYLMTKHLGLPSVWAPYANADEDNHSPNEKMGVKDFLDGIRCTAVVLTRVAEALKK
jgi:acetylornithine deacetylase/succinyl-diaminopimelate desuccinylase-like protein